MNMKFKEEHETVTERQHKPNKDSSARYELS